jgi:hypothetical protein
MQQCLTDLTIPRVLPEVEIRSNTLQIAFEVPNSETCSQGWPSNSQIGTIMFYFQLIDPSSSSICNNLSPHYPRVIELAIIYLPHQDSSIKAVSSGHIHPIF